MAIKGNPARVSWKQAGDISRARPARKPARFFAPLLLVLLVAPAVIVLAGNLAPETGPGQPAESALPLGIVDHDELAEPGAIRHVFVIVMENRAYTEVWNTTATPYITQLGKTFTRAASYYALTHPSLPNYLMMSAGSNYGITKNCTPSNSCRIRAKHIGDSLDAKGLRWKGYMESMPKPCTLEDSGRYKVRHNPFAYFDNVRTNLPRCRRHIVPYTALATDLATRATTPHFAMIIPDICNDMHDCSIRRGDTWLKDNLPPIFNSPACSAARCLIVLTFDEDDGRHKNRILTIFAGSGARKGFVSFQSYTHYSLLRTIEDIFDLPTLTKNDAAAQPMTDMLR